MIDSKCRSTPTIFDKNIDNFGALSGLSNSRKEEQKILLVS